LSRRQKYKHNRNIIRCAHTPEPNAAFCDQTNRAVSQPNRPQLLASKPTVSCRNQAPASLHNLSNRLGSQPSKPFLASTPRRPSYAQSKRSHLVSHISLNSILHIKYKS
jgi:hypothetical protein